MRLHLALALALLCQVATAHAQGAINTNSTAYAIGGYDPVAYFTDGKPVSGKPEHAATARGAQWLFASAEHRALFDYCVSVFELDAALGPMKPGRP